MVATLVAIVMSGALLLASAAPVLAAEPTAGRTPGQVIDDTTLALRVKSRLVADRPANLTRIDVRVMRGVVHLSGEVDTPEERARAEAIALESAGPGRVVDDIHVKGRVSTRG